MVRVLGPCQAQGQGPSPLEPLPRSLLDALGAADLARLRTMGQPLDRWRHGLARAGLRILLGQVLGIEAAKLNIQPDHQGKPQLVLGSTSPRGPQFNLSHGGDLVLLALHPSQAVGVDGERLDRRCHPERLASRLLGESQQRELASLPVEQRREALLRQWCRLEAQLKCSGQGLAGLESLRQARGGRNPAQHVLDLALPAGYCGALAWTRPISAEAV